MKIRPLPAVLSLVISLAVLFVGWFVYEQFKIKQPIAEIIEKQEKITAYRITVSPRKIVISLTVKPSFTLASDYTVLREDVKRVTSREDVTITLDDHPDDYLYAAWNQLYFTFAEGIANRQYSKIVSQLDSAPISERVRVEVAMDEDYLYVWMQEQRGNHSLFHLLPLNEEDGVLPSPTT